MTTVENILHELHTLAPSHMQQSWDNCGLLCGRYKNPVTKILIALDPFLNVAKEAKELGAQLIVTHHPLLFSVKNVTDGEPIGNTMLYLIENGIASINLHTNLDCVHGGVNDVLAASLGLENREVLVRDGVDEKGNAYGLGRVGTVPELPLQDFLQQVKTALGCGGIRFASGGKQVHKVAVGGGSCGDCLEIALEQGCDTFVTGDVKYNGFANAKDLGINLIDAGHFPTENLICQTLKEYLELKFPLLEVVISKSHDDVVKFY